MPIWIEIALYWLGATLAGALIIYLVNCATAGAATATHDLKGRVSRLNGWQRLGVVLSGAWALLILGAATFNTVATKLIDYLLALTVPIIALWAAGYGLTYAVRWLAEGFGWKPGQGPPLLKITGSRIDMPVWALVLVVLLAVLIGLLLAPTPRRSNVY